MNNAAARLLMCLGFVATLTACGDVPLPALPFADTATPSLTPSPTSTFTPSPTPTLTSTPTPKPTLTPTATLAPIGDAKRIPAGFIYLGDKEHLALGFNMGAGGAIGSLLYNGREYIDRKDYGRYVQLSLYDGGDTYKPQHGDPFGNWGWNPVQAGNKLNQGARVLEYRTSENAVYIKARGRQWGNNAMPSDEMFETWAWLRDSYFEVHVRATHFGSDFHASAQQELPAAYFDGKLDNGYSYFGAAPFTGEPIENARLLVDSPSCEHARPTEDWVAFGNDAGRSLMLVVPPQPYLTSRWIFCYLSYHMEPVGYVAAVAAFGNPPNAVREATFYLIPGFINRSRAILYDLIPHTIWNFNLQTSEGWHSSSATETLGDGLLTTTLGPDDMLTSSAFQVRGAGAPSVTVRARVQDTFTAMCVYFLAADDAYWNRDKSSCVPVVPGEFQTYTFDFTGNPIWNNSLITQLGLTTSSPTGIDIDDIRIDQQSSP